MGKKIRMLTARKFASEMDVDYSTVVRWLKLELVPGAEKKEAPDRGEYWEIPETSLKMERPKAGRKRANEKAEQDGAVTKAAKR